MSHELYHKACRVLLTSALCLFVAGAHVAGQASQQSAGKNAQSTSATAATAPSSEGSKYVGAETCKTCHEEIYNVWEKTPHWKTTLNIKGGPSKQGCEGCHGPGADHVAGGGDKTKIFVFEGKSRQETSARCLSCHGEAHEQSHFAESAHSSSDVQQDVSTATLLITPRKKSSCSSESNPNCVTAATSPPRRTLPNPITTASMRVWCNVWTATIRMEREPSASYGPCRAVTPFATSAMSTSKVLSSMSTCP